MSPYFITLMSVAGVFVVLSLISLCLNRHKDELLTRLNQWEQKLEAQRSKL